MKTYYPKPAEIERPWVLVDASGQVVGRLAARIAIMLQGKHRPTYQPSVDTGDFVVVVNAGEMVFTGRKLQQKVYHRYTGWPSGLRRRTAETLMKDDPGEVLRLAVKRMLPKNRLGRQLLSKLRVFPGPEHPHAAQNPQPVQLELK